MYSALKALVDLKEWKMCMEKTAHTLNRDICMGKYALELVLNFKKVMVVEGFALYFNRHAIYDHSYYER
jgi:hypothetical protein